MPLMRPRAMPAGARMKGTNSRDRTDKTMARVPNQLPSNPSSSPFEPFPAGTGSATSSAASTSTSPVASPFPVSFRFGEFRPSFPSRWGKSTLGGSVLRVARSIMPPASIRPSICSSSSSRKECPVQYGFSIVCDEGGSSNFPDYGAFPQGQFRLCLPPPSFVSPNRQGGTAGEALRLNVRTRCRAHRNRPFFGDSFRHPPLKSAGFSAGITPGCLQNQKTDLPKFVGVRRSLPLRPLRRQFRGCVHAGLRQNRIAQQISDPVPASVIRGPAPGAGGPGPPDEGPLRRSGANLKAAPTFVSESDPTGSPSCRTKKQKNPATTVAGSRHRLIRPVRLPCNPEDRRDGGGHFSGSAIP